MALIFTHDGCLISGSEDCTIKVWSKQYDLFKTLDNDWKWVWSLAITSDGLLVSGDNYGIMKVWSKEYELKRTLSKDVGGGHSS